MKDGAGSKRGKSNSTRVHSWQNWDSVSLVAYDLKSIPTRRTKISSILIKTGYGKRARSRRVSGWLWKDR